jgi:hypothetical protein
MDDERRTKLKLSKDARRHWEETEASWSRTPRPSSSLPHSLPSGARGSPLSACAGSPKGLL